MNINAICLKIVNYKVDQKTEDFEVNVFFDTIGEEILKLNVLSTTEKEKLIQSLFKFVQNQDPEMDEKFSFIHLIENIDKPTQNIYNAELLKFNLKYGTITSTHLLNRHINSLNADDSAKYINILKSIAENDTYTKYVRKEALGYYNYQKDKT